MPPDRPSVTFGRQAKASRNKLRLTQEQLAERLRDLGSKLDRVAIARIESAGRKLSLDEALEIALALGVSPLHLFTPRERGARTALAPKLEVDGTKARAWVRGFEPLPDPVSTFFFDEMSEDEKEALQQRAIEVLRSQGFAPLQPQPSREVKSER